MRILCGGPVSEVPNVFAAHVEALAGQGLAMDYKGIDDSPVPLASPGSDSFSSVTWRYSGGMPEYKTKSVRWTRSRLEHVGDLREEMRLAAVEVDYDYLFMVDSDLVLGDGTLAKLLADGKDIVCGLFWTKFRPWHRRVWANVYMLDGNGSGVAAHAAPPDELVARLRAGGVHEVEVSGGCTLISKRALPAISFKAHADMASEDVCMGRTARAAGIPIFLDCDVKIEHRRTR
jgi:hypothetical protein